MTDKLGRAINSQRSSPLRETRRPPTSAALPLFLLLARTGMRLAEGFTLQ